MGSTSAMPTAPCTRRPTSASWARPQAPPYRAPRRPPARPARLRLPARRGLLILLVRLPNKLGQRQPLFQRSARCERIAGLYLPDAFCESLLCDAKESDLEGRVQLLRLRRGWPFGSTVLQSLQHAPDADYPGYGRALQHAAKHCDERSGQRVHRSSELPCKQCNRWSALRVLKATMA